MLSLSVDKLCIVCYALLDNIFVVYVSVYTVNVVYDSCVCVSIPIAIQEIYDWMSSSGNENEFVIVYINDQTSDSDWGHIDLIQNPVINITKDLLFTPTMKNSLFPKSWLALSTH